MEDVSLSVAWTDNNDLANFSIFICLCHLTLDPSHDLDQLT